MDQTNISVRERGHASNRRKKGNKQKDKQVVEEVRDVIVELNYQGEETNIEDNRTSIATAEEDYDNDSGGNGGDGNGDGDDNGDGDGDDVGDGDGDAIPIPLTKPIRRSRKNRGPDVRVLNGVSKTGPFPGGPNNISLLSGFYDHVALKVWLGEERGALKVVHHTKKLREWKIQLQWSRFRERVSESGLRVLTNALPQINKALVSAFVERWHSETNTFHMPFGEMSITLEDVVHISDLSIEGDVIFGSADMTFAEAVALVTRCLGIEAVVVENEFEKNNGFYLRLDWIKKQMSGKESVPDDSGGEEDENYYEKAKATVDCAVRGYLLYCFGCNLLCDKSGNKVSIVYLRYLEDLDKVKNYAWGAIGLAFLYRELGHAARFDVMQIAGFLALLEVWIYEHFPIFRGSINKDYIEPQPRMSRWSTSGGVPDADSALIVYRQQIDQLLSTDVVWDPYREQRQTTRPINDRSFYEGLLFCVDIKMAYLPNRFLRQFGLRQSIPLDLVSVHGNYYSQWCNHVFAHDKRITLVDGLPDTENGYFEWFVQHSHPRVQNLDKWIGPRASGPSTTPATFDAESFAQAKMAKNILDNLIQKGKKWCGKAYEDIKRARNHLLHCRGGASTAQDDERVRDENDGDGQAQAQTQYQRRRTNKKRKP